MQDDLYLLQSRPITTLNAWSEYELVHEFDNPVLSNDELNVRANVGEVLPLAIAPLSLDVLIKPLDEINTKNNRTMKFSKYYTQFLTVFQYVVHLNATNVSIDKLYM